ncbi:MAG: TolC family protein, partial [Planctomycetota bacterium]|nr:TolC family protein [Planctomycetota bacterium]
MKVRVWIAGLAIAASLFGASAAQAGGRVGLEDSLTLPECMMMALTHNRDVKRARLELQKVGGDRIIEKARFLPHLDLLGGYDRTQSNSDANVVRDKSASVRLTQRIFEFGRDASSLVALRQDQRDAFFALENIAASTLRRVREGFFSILLRQEQIRARQANLVRFRNSLERERKLYEKRESQRTDVLTAELSVSQEELRINRQQRGLLRERMDLMQLLGRPIASTTEFEGRLETFDMREDQSVAIALINSTSVALAKEELGEQRRVTSEVATSYYPDLNLSAGVENKSDVFSLNLGRSGSSDTWALDATAEHFFIRPNSRFTRFQGDGFEDVGNEYVWFLNFDVVMPVFRGFERKGKLVKERARLRQLAIELDNSRAVVELNVRQTYQRFLEQVEAVRLQEESLRITREQLDIVK